MTTINNPRIDNMFKAGAHFAFSRTRRHPTVTPYIFGVKNNVEIFDLEKTEVLLEKAKAFIESLAKDSKTILFVGGKSEARNAIKSGALSINMPYVDGRWIGGTLTNFTQIRKRVEKLEKLTGEKEKGELAKYTKKERLMIDREIANLERFFSGIISMKDLPKALFVVDPKKEKTAIREAQDMGISVIALSGSDCNIKGLDFPLVGNDSSQTSVNFFVQEIVKAYSTAKKV
ncbi:MAG: 30S ribosomal protein S2 [Candidatus Taylorbacteria bacterium]|nr:30S ribosomal protein S2 [Candidatus Taylorbacteria bacterium]